MLQTPQSPVLAAMDEPVITLAQAIDQVMRALSGRHFPTHDDTVAEMLRSDAQFRANTVAQVLAGGNLAELHTLLRQLTRAEAQNRAVAMYAEVAKMRIK